MNERVNWLLAALGLDPASFAEFVEWVLDEHLVVVIASDPIVNSALFRRPDARKVFRDALVARTGRQWSDHDQDVLYQRVKAAHAKHHREPIPYGEYLKLLWQVPWQCASCRRAPPVVQLHVDHVVPASLGGPSRRENLQFLCAEDNLRKSNKREAGQPWLDLK